MFKAFDIDQAKGLEAWVLSNAVLQIALGAGQSYVVN
jgi:hypothetical protein